MVAYCPDQLGPSVSRLLPPGFDQVTFPRGNGPELIDWVDYQKVNEAADPRLFGDQLLERAAGKDLWLVWSGGYKTVKWTCDFLVEHLESRRPGMERVARVNLRYF